MHIKLKGEITSKLKERNDELQKEVEKAMKKATYRVHRELTQILSGSRSGRIYRVPSTKRTYQASAENEAPAVRLGDLRTSYRPQVLKQGWASEGHVGSPLKYAYFLENGTQSIRPRKHLKPAFENSQKDWVKFFENLI